MKMLLFFLTREGKPLHMAYNGHTSAYIHLKMTGHCEEWPVILALIARTPYNRAGFLWVINLLFVLTSSLDLIFQMESLKTLLLMGPTEKMYFSTR